jgi:hypothetical protein
MAVTVLDNENRPLQQQFWRNVCLYAVVGLFTVFLAGCSSSKNKVPEFTSDTAISVPEGTTATGYTATATDGNKRAILTFSVTGGADAAQFSIDSETGVLSFVAVTDYLNPTDANGDNVYEVQLTVDDGRKNGTATLDLTVTVTSVNVDPVFTSAATASVTEGSTAIGYTATADDANGDTLSFSLSGGTDQAQFSIDSATGVLSFVTAPDFAAPADANADNDYEVQLTVDDGRTGTATLDLVVTVLEQGNFSLEVTYPTPNANLGGGVTQTTVTGNIVDSTGTPINLADIDFVNVNGVAATLDMANPGRWSVQVPVAAGPNTLDLELGLTSGSIVNSSLNLHNFAVHVFFSKMDLDTANNRALVVDGRDGLLAVDLTTGDRTVISGNGTGAGLTLRSPTDVAVDSANDRALVTDWLRDTLFAVDLASGDRTELSSAGAGAGIALDGPEAVALDSANGRALVIAGIDSVLVAVDLATGDRTALSGPGVGAGPDFGFPFDVEVDAANNRALVADDDLDAIFAVDLGSGDRTVLSDAGTGAGPALDRPGSISLDAANNRLLVVLGSDSLIAVDLTSGDRTELAETTRTAYGANGTRLQGVATDSANNRALLGDSTVDAIFAIDFASGTRTILSDSSTGAGATLASLAFGRGLALDGNRDQLVFTSSTSLSVITIDLRNGDRSILADIGNTPGRVAIDANTDRAALIIGNTLSELDLGTGDRTLLSANTGPGTGTDFAFVADVVVDFANNRAAVLDGGAGLLSVALDSGDRSIISDSTTGSGPMWGFADALDVDLPADVGYVVDDADTAVYSVDMSTGDRAIVSDNANIGMGPNISFPNDLKLDVAANRALIVNRGAGPNFMVVDLTTGDRAMISGAGIGSGPSFQSPHYVALDLANNRAFIYDLAVTAVLVVELSTGERAVASK